MEKSNTKINETDIAKQFEEVTEDKINSWEVNTLFIFNIANSFRF